MHGVNELKRQIGYNQTMLKRKERDYAEALQERRDKIAALEAEVKKMEAAQ
ncbi:hypothetical protein F7P69_00730 [Cellulosimicrobium funkei]|nr:hypothetical protein [Cellulosimicrobium funkei]